MAKNNSGIENVGLSEVSQADRKSWPSIAFIWAGGVCCVPALMVGAGITAGMPFGQGVLAMFLGYAICVLLMVLMSILSADKGVPTVVAASGAFGKIGSGYVVSFIIAFCFICWFGFQAVVCGEAFAGILATMGLPIPGWLSTVIWGLIMCLTAVFGINWIKILNVVSVPALVVILVYAAIVVFSDSESAAAIANYEPAGSITMVSAIGMAVGGFATGSVLSGDTTRYCKSRRIVNMLSSVGSPILGLLVLVLATWTTNVSNAYSAGFALLSLTRAKDEKRAMFTLIAGVLGTALAILGITNYFNNFLNILAAFIPPVAGVVIMDYFVFNRANPKSWKPVAGFNWAGILAWIGGSVVALAFPSIFVPTINGIVIACVLYLILYPLFGVSKKRYAESAE